MAVLSRGRDVQYLVLTPMGYYLARWMNRKAFGKHLEALRSRIQSLGGND